MMMGFLRILNSSGQFLISIAYLRFTSVSSGGSFVFSTISVTITKSTKNKNNLMIIFYYYVNTKIDFDGSTVINLQDELVSKNRALLFSMLF